MSYEGTLTVEEIAKFMGKSLPFVRGAIEMVAYRLDVIRQ